MFFAQFGEDRLLAEMFSGISAGSCVEVGANDGITGSMTLHFEQKGWQCVLVEPNTELCALLRQSRSAQVYECAASSKNGTAILFVAEGGDLAHAVSTVRNDGFAAQSITQHGYSSRQVSVNTRTMDSILDEAGVASPIDFVSIDVEGHEMDVLAGFSLGRWKPGILIVEDNSFFSAGKLPAFLKQAGYVRFRRTGVNDWYAHKEDPRFDAWGGRSAYIPRMISARFMMARQRIFRRVAQLPVMGSIARAIYGTLRSRDGGR